MKTFGKNDPITIDDVLVETDKYIKKPENRQLILDAYEYAKEKHKNQVRKSGDPYIVHLLHVALTLSDLKVDPQTIAAGLLHDTIEDCDVDEDAFKEKFGDEIYHLVESVTKIGKLKFNDEKEYLASNHRKIFIAMASDVRVIMIKLADRLHNMRTLQFMSEEKQRKISQETLEVYAPIAHRLGISELKNELEDLSFRYLDNTKYKEIASLVEQKKAERDAHVSKMIDEISEELDSHDITYNIFGRSKHLYSIYKKMTVKHKRFAEIFDLLAIRIITDTEVSCYEILGYIHAKYKPIPGRFKDYIAMPKTNMYQSLHTTIVGEEGLIYEVQIRTKKMDDVAERGVAAHWRYKENQYQKDIQQKEIEEQLSWFKDFAKMSEDSDSDAKDMMNIISNDIFEANVYVMSPKGRVIALPQGSTPLDFAYRIHTDVGHQTVGAKVNNVLVPLNTKLKNGDVVNIMTNKNSTPSEDWLKIVKSGHAKQKIRSYFVKKKQKEKEEGIVKGKQLLEDELIKRGFDPKEYMNKKHVESICGNFNLHSEQDFYYAIYCKSVTLVQAVEKLTHQKTFHSLKDLSLKSLFNKKSKKNSNKQSSIIVGGMSGMKYSLSKCCSPVYGDEIVGYVTKNDGVKIHRKDCPNVSKMSNRLIEAKWDEDLSKNEQFIANIEIISTNRNYLLSDIVTVASQNKISIDGVNSQVSDDKRNVTTIMKVVVKNTDHLKAFMTNLRKIENVLDVKRLTM